MPRPFWWVVSTIFEQGDSFMRFGDPPPCDRCREPSIVQIVILAFEGSSPPDQFLCRAHASGVYEEAHNGTGTET